MCILCCLLHRIFVICLFVYFLTLALQNSFLSLIWHKVSLIKFSLNISANNLKK